MWPDLIAASDVKGQVLQDPDLSRKPGGGLMVLAGANTVTWERLPNGQYQADWVSGGPLARIDGEESDVCWIWQTAFREFDFVLVDTPRVAAIDIVSLLPWLSGSRL